MSVVSDFSASSSGSFSSRSSSSSPAPSGSTPPSASARPRSSPSSGRSWAPRRARPGLPGQPLWPPRRLIPFFGKKYSVSTALRQRYLRNQMVNSEEGTPDGRRHLVRDAGANRSTTSSSTPTPKGPSRPTSPAPPSPPSATWRWIRCSRSPQPEPNVRSNVSPLSEKWGYRLGSVYIRKYFSPTGRWSTTSRRRSSNASSRSPAR